MADIYTTLSDLNTRMAEMLTKYNNLSTDIDTIVDNKVAEKLATVNVASSNDSTKLDGKSLKEVKRDVLPEGTIEEFYLVVNGKKLRYNTDEIDQILIDDGFELFCPHSSDEYELARRYLVSINNPKSMGPLGIYYPADGPGSPTIWTSNGWFSGIPLNSDGLGKKGWLVKDGSKLWWASDLTTVTEPNGDYAANAYLGITYSDDGHIQWYNDAGNRYSYVTYLCVKRVKK